MDQKLLKTLAALREDRTLTDCEITRGTVHTSKVPVQVHRFVVAMHSKILLESCRQVSGTNGFTLKLNYRTEDCIDRLVSFMYTLDYDLGENQPCDHAEMYDFARTWGMSLLGTKALENFRSALPTWDLEFFQSNSDLVGDLTSYLYREGLESLCGLFVKHAIDIGALGEASLTRDDMLQLAQDYPVFGADLIKELGKREDERKSGRG